MGEESDRTLMLLQELALLKEEDDGENRTKSAAHRKRRNEIGKEIKQIAREKRQTNQ
jgi:hypothetical protein